MAKDMPNKVSIRLMSGGHTFSNRDVELISGAGDDAVVEIVTHKTVLRPEQGFDKDSAYIDLVATGYVVDNNEVVVCSRAHSGRVAVMAVSAKCVEAIEALGVDVAYTSPLLTGEDLAEGSDIALYDDVLYVRVYKEGLRFAEAMLVKCDEDILFYLLSIHQVYDIYNMYARAIGDVKRLNKVCGKLFKTKL